MTADYSKLRNMLNREQGQQPVEHEEKDLMAEAPYKESPGERSGRWIKQLLAFGICVVLPALWLFKSIEKPAVAPVPTPPVEAPPAPKATTVTGLDAQAQAELQRELAKLGQIGAEIGNEVAKALNEAFKDEDIANQVREAMQGAMTQVPVPAPTSGSGNMEYLKQMNEAGYLGQFQAFELNAMEKAGVTVEDLNTLKALGILDKLQFFEIATLKKPISPRMNYKPLQKMVGLDALLRMKL